MVSICSVVRVHYTASCVSPDGGIKGSMVVRPSESLPCSGETMRYDCDASRPCSPGNCDGFYVRITCVSPHYPTQEEMQAWGDMGPPSWDWKAVSPDSN
ncbi:hypothetical protein HY638_03770 [Candidatus Woesearchaeota archaeon]|nr:hypothetical protein [Candidatus Woesearchaeota archaeon]